MNTDLILKSKIINNYNDVIYLQKENRKYCESFKTLSLVNGTFRLFHPGHIRLLNEASKYADKLLVLINTDESIQNLKGIDKYITPLEERLFCISALHCVDYILPFKEQRINIYLEYFKPDYWIKGPDYTINNINQEERKIAEQFNVNIKFLKNSFDYSSTKLIEQLKQLN